MVLAHPQSMARSMAEFFDDSLLAQMPESRCCAPFDFHEIGGLDFIEPNMERFSCLKLAYGAMETKTTAVFNTAVDTAIREYVMDIL